MKMVKTVLSSVVLALGFAGVAAASPLNQQMMSAIQQHLSQKQQYKATPSKLSKTLQDIATQGIPKSLDAQQSAVLRGGTVEVQFVADTNRGAALEQSLRQKGAYIYQRIGDVILANVQPQQLNQLVASPMVLAVDVQSVSSVQDEAVQNLLNNLFGDDAQRASGQAVQNRPNNRPSSPATGSSKQADEGVQATYAYLMHQNNYQGQGIKVGIIDFGYAHYQTLLNQNVVPQPKKTMKLYGTQSTTQLDMAGNATVHGSATAEVIYSVAPKAEFYLAQVGDGQGRASDSDVINAIDWMVSQGVNIINFSGGGHGKALDGTAFLDKKIDQISRQNILWVNAAGNEGNKHWIGKIQDNNGNGFIDTGLDDDVLLLNQSQDGGMSILVNWDDWQGSKRGSQGIDVDAFLLTQNANGQMVLVATADEPRTRGSNASEMMTGRLPKGQYYLVLKSDKSADKNVHVVVNGIQFDPRYRKNEGSIASPATAESALSVAGWDVRDRDIAPYSGQGRTDDGRLKPDVAAPTGTLNAAYQAAQENNGRYHGTSAASPYAAGFAAAYWSGNQSLNSQQVKTALMQNLSQNIGGSPNGRSGYGLLDARKINFSAGAGTPLPEIQRDTPVSPQPQPQPQPNPDNAVQRLLDNLGL